MVFPCNALIERYLYFWLNLLKKSVDRVIEKRLNLSHQKIIPHTTVLGGWEGFFCSVTSCLDLSSAGNVVAEIFEKSFHLPELFTETLHEFSFYCFKQN